MIRRLRVLERLDLEVGNGGAADVRHAHAEHQRIHEVAHDHVPPLRRLVLGEPLVGVQRMVVHRHHAEQVVVGFGDGLAGPMAVDIAHFEILVVAAEWAVVDGHGCTSSGRTIQIPAIAGLGFGGTITVTASRASRHISKSAIAS